MIVSVTITAALILNLLVSLNTISDGVEEAQADTASQIARTLEISLAQIEDSAFSASLDRNLVELTESFGASPAGENPSLFRALRAVQLRNRFVAEVSLYHPGSGRVLIGTVGVTQSLEDYQDAAALIDNAGSAPLTLLPRRTTVFAEEGLYMTLVSPVPLQAREPVAYVVVYVDAQTMFHDVVRRIQADPSQRMTVHVIEDDVVILSTDFSNVLGSLDADELETISPMRRLLSTLTGRPVRSFVTANSSRLGWDVVLETFVDTGGGSARAVRYTSALVLSLVVAGTLVAGRWFRASRVHEEAYVRAQWAQYLSNPAGAVAPVRHLPGIAFDPSGHLCGVIAMKTVDEGLSQPGVVVVVEKLVTGRDGVLSYLLVPTSPSRIDILIAVRFHGGGGVIEELARELNRSIGRIMDTPCFTASSSLMRSLEALPIAHRECTTALDYRLCSGSNHIRYPDINARVERDTYPYDIVHRLLNQVTARDSELALQELAEFSTFLRDPAYRIPDTRYRGFYMQLCADIQRHAYVSFGLGSPAPSISSDECDPDRMYRTSKEYVESIIRKARKLQSGRSLEDEVMHYIDDNLLDPNLNLNAVADSFDAHRNHISRIVHKVSGSHFTDYMHQQRIQHAKRLLVETSMSVAEVAEAAGFSYAHHFIRVFKGIEGITPGQYQKSSIAATPDDATVDTSRNA